MKGHKYSSVSTPSFCSTQFLPGLESLLKEEAEGFVPGALTTLILVAHTDKTLDADNCVWTLCRKNTLLVVVAPGSEESREHAIQVADGHGIPHRRLFLLDFPRGLPHKQGKKLLTALNALARHARPDVVVILEVDGR